MSNVTNRRKQLVVNKPLQSRFILEIAWPSIICLVITAVILAWLCRSLVMEAQSADVELFAIVPLMMTVIAYLFVSTAFLIFNALKLSNRLAGPMYRFRMVLDRVKAGDKAQRIKLRDKDFLTEVADDLNGFLAWVEAGARPQPSDASSDTPQGAQDPAGSTTDGAHDRSTDDQASNEATATSSGTPDLLENDAPTTDASKTDAPTTDDRS